MSIDVHGVSKVWQKEALQRMGSRQLSVRGNGVRFLAGVCLQPEQAAVHVMEADPLEE